MRNGSGGLDEPFAFFTKIAVFGKVIGVVFPGNAGENGDIILRQSILDGNKRGGLLCGGLGLLILADGDHGNEAIHIVALAIKNAVLTGIGFLAGKKDVLKLGFITDDLNGKHLL